MNPLRKRIRQLECRRDELMLELSAIPVRDRMLEHYKKKFQLKEVVDELEKLRK